MESFVTCLVFLALGLLFAPLILSLAHARKLKTLQTTLQKLSERTTLLEAQFRGTTTPPVTTPAESVSAQAAEAPATPPARAVPVCCWWRARPGSARRR